MRARSLMPKIHGRRVHSGQAALIARWALAGVAVVALLGCGAGGGAAGYPDPGDAPVPVGGDGLDGGPYSGGDPCGQHCAEVDDDQYDQGVEDGRGEVAQECADAGPDYDDITQCLEDNQ